MKKFLAVLLAFAMVFSLGACSNAGGGSAAPAGSGTGGNTGKIKIGVSIWSSTDVLGSQCKKVLDEAAKALDVQLMYVDQGHVSEKVTASVETLCAAGCKGIVICNSADSEMTAAINTANESQVYLAQFFRIISKEKSPQIWQMAQSAPYYLGAVHEDEEVNGYNLANILINKGKRFICLEGWTVGDATFLQRWAGYKKAVSEWNQKHPDDKVTMTDPVYANTSSEEGASVTKSFLNSYPKMDSLIVAGGGGDPLVGSIGALKNAGKTGKIAVVSTDFLPDLGQQLSTGGMTAESGGHYCDPLYAFLMVYNAVQGKYKKPNNGILEIKYPYLYVSSKNDYDLYKKYFVDSLPYTDKEIKALANEPFDQLNKSATSMSIKDVQSRHGG